MKNCSRNRSRRASRRSGFTLLETMVALSILSIVGYGLAVAVNAGSHSQSEVTRVATEDRALRSASSVLSDDLGSCRGTSISITALADGNHQVRFMLPIEVGGNPAWGVYDPHLGPDAATQTRVGWWIQYTVVNAVDGNGRATKELHRQILDDTFVVRRDQTLATGLHSGSDTPPGFTMVRVGDLWELTISTAGHTANTTGMRTEFHVHTRN